MWFFRSPDIIFGEGALEHLENIQGHKALIVTDENIVAPGLCGKGAGQALPGRHGNGRLCRGRTQPLAADRPARRPEGPGLRARLDHWSGRRLVHGRGQVDLDPVRAARPGPRTTSPPRASLGLRQKARLIAIPTTSGTGAEVTWPIVLTDLEEQRKLSVGHSENIPDLAIVDPDLCQPPAGPDHGRYRHGRPDPRRGGLYLPLAQRLYRRPVPQGDPARLRLSCPAPTRRAARTPKPGKRCTTPPPSPGWALATRWRPWPTAWATPWARSLPIPHGRAVGLCLPYTIEFTARG